MPNKIFSLYKAQRKQAQVRGIAFLLSFEEWYKIWIDSGYWAQRGRKRGQYVMARKGDKGPYAVGNVKICTVTENLKEKKISPAGMVLIIAANLGRKQSIETKQKRARSLIGKKRSQETKDILSSMKLGNKNPNFGKRWRWITDGNSIRMLGTGKSMPKGWFYGVTR